MKYAISADTEYVSSHFGRCPEFIILDVKDGKLISREVIENPGHQPGFLPQFLKEKGVNCIISGGMGPRAKELFSEAKIDTILGVDGKIQDVIDKLLLGALEGGESSCKHGAGHGYGIDKSECDHE